MQTNMHTYLLLAVLLAFSLTAYAGPSGELHNWTGQGDGWSWSDPDNWDTQNVPIEGDSAFIGGEAYVHVTGEKDAVAAFVKITDGATLFIPSDMSLNLGYSEGSSILMQDESTLVIWGTLDITHSGNIGLEMQDDSRALNRGTLKIEYTDHDAIDLEDNAAMRNRGDLELSYIGEEGIELDDDAQFHNVGDITMSYLEDSDGIDMEDSDTYFENDGLISIQFVLDEAEGIEVDEGTFVNKPSGKIELGFISGDYVLLQSDGEITNYGSIDIMFVPFGNMDNIPASTEILDIDVRSAIEVECGAVFTNEGEVDIELSLGGQSTPQELPFELEFISSLNVECGGGTLHNKDCATISIEGPLPMNNSGTLINEGYLNIDAGFLFGVPTIPFAHVNTGYFLNDGDIDAGEELNIGPAPVTEEWERNDIGNNAADSEIALGCGIQMQTDAVTFPNSSSDNIAFLSQNVCGDFIFEAKIDVAEGGFGGLMVRENHDADARMIGLLSNLGYNLRAVTRYNTGDPLSMTPHHTAFVDRIRIQRVNNYFRAFYGSGSGWQMFAQFYMDLPACVEVGLMAVHDNTGEAANISYSEVAFSGGTVIPTLSTPDQPSTTAAGPKQKAKVWPNPVQNQFTLELAQETAAAGTAVLRNELGQAVDQRLLQAGMWQLQFDAHDLPGGLYLLEVQTEDGYRETLKVIKP